ncbi:hypothetical protein UUU_02710 [Klebsiella pneumoniae subsp. pneumoniae DSM 30104 = JCM 1662 = NBRC 14940]|nr:hypothetical protein UUU_02710 [Klebsiella pneumoniae subsp. pneumoniae DSM 30104 = JCM 1662 = NBRC 14940]
MKQEKLNPLLSITGIIKRDNTGQSVIYIKTIGNCYFCHRGTTLFSQFKKRSLKHRYLHRMIKSDELRGANTVTEFLACLSHFP